MRKVIMGTALALSLAFAGTAQAERVTTTFDGFADGSVNGRITGAAGRLMRSTTSRRAVIGGKALRVSNAVTSGSFGEMPYSEAGR